MPKYRILRTKVSKIDAMFNLQKDLIESFNQEKIQNPFLLNVCNYNNDNENTIIIDKPKKIKKDLTNKFKKSDGLTFKEYKSLVIKFTKETLKNNSIDNKFILDNVDIIEKFKSTLLDENWDKTINRFLLHCQDGNKFKFRF